jgi:nitrate reductase (cytochrome), electron transfer subunit
MSPRGLLSRALGSRLVLIGAAVAVMAGGISMVEVARARDAAAAAADAAGDTHPGPPIPAEADVFRLQPGDLALGEDDGRRAGARTRTLAVFRSLRAYPGAPPRVPHSLAPDEFRASTCNACHERGGFTARFSAYAPVTPHPEYRNCLQCHAVDDGVVGVAAPGRLAARSDARTERATAPDFVPLAWRTVQWPTIDQRAMPGSPPAIPHTLELRGNCLACHAGAGAVAEIRTTHPERANCRQCHVPSTYDVGSDAFSRPITLQDD